MQQVAVIQFSTIVLITLFNCSKGTNEPLDDIKEYLPKNWSFRQRSADISDDYKNLTEYFPCQVILDNGLHVSCTNVDIKNVSKYIPIQTKTLSISDCLLPVFKESLFEHLSQLESLSLTNNHHRFITSKPFKGLNNLKFLNLSHNDIMVIKTAFMYTPELEVIDFSSNLFSNLSIISYAVSSLKNLTRLILNHNTNLRRILGNNFLDLKNSPIKRLELLNTTINYVEKEAFKPLSQLKELDLSINYIDEKMLINVTDGLSGTTIEVLFLRLLVGLQDFPYEALAQLENTTVKKLDFSYNSNRKFPVFPLISSLTSLVLTDCNIISFEKSSFKHLPNLVNLNLDYNEIALLENDFVTLRNLTSFSLQNQLISELTAGAFYIKDFFFTNATNLQKLSFRKTNLGDTIYRHSLFGLKRLKILSLMETRTIFIEDYAFETLSSLEDLSLRGNDIRYLNNFTLYGLKNVKFLELSFNNLFFPEEFAPFQNMPKLTVLFLTMNRIEVIPRHIFSELNELKFLILIRNSITAWKEPLFSEHANLSLLHMSRNQLTHITPAMMKDFTRVEEYLDLTENPFNCSSCNMEDFQSFMSNSPLQFKYPFTIKNATYSCMNPPELRGQLILNSNLTKYRCIEILKFRNDIFVAALCCSVIATIFLLMWVCYYFRWYIRYCWFHYNARFTEHRTSSTDLGQYIYDAFVTYNSSDTSWIISHLIPELEGNEPKLRLCIHERDFKVGRLITENILEAIEVSRKVILLLSEDFLKSEWCMFELHMAQNKLFDDKRDAIVLVKFQQLDRKLYTKDLSYLEKTRPCLMWTEDVMGQRLFWDKLRKALKSKPKQCPVEPKQYAIEKLPNI